MKQLTLDDNQVLVIYIMSNILGLYFLGRNLPWSKEKIFPSKKLFCVEHHKKVAASTCVSAIYVESNLPDGTEIDQTFK